jgi:DNA-binding transcriptional regulator YhcF (GntR family)
MQGYIKLHRKILDNGVFEDAELLKVFVWCILKANTTSNMVYGRKVDIGQFITGRITASEELKIRPSTIYKRLQKLKRQGYIDLSSTTKNTLITVVNYKSYQLEEPKKKRNLQNVTDKFVLEVSAFKEKYSTEMLEAFVDYWTEPNKSKTKLRYELQKTFDVGRRLKTWSKNDSKFNNKKSDVMDTWQDLRNEII